MAAQSRADTRYDRSTSSGRCMGIVAIVAMSVLTTDIGISTVQRAVEWPCEKVCAVIGVTLRMQYDVAVNVHVDVRSISVVRQRDDEGVERDNQTCI